MVALCRASAHSEAEKADGPEHHACGRRRDAEVHRARGRRGRRVYYPTDFSIPTAKTKVGKDLVRKVKETYNRDADYVHAQAYDAFNAGVLAIKAAGAPDKTKIRNALKKIEFTGTRGTFKFDYKGDPTHAAGMILVKGGKETDANEQN